MNSLSKFKNLYKEVLHEHQNINKPIVLIDGMNLFIRAFSANPSINDNGEPIGGVVGVIKSLGKIVNDFKPSRCIIVFDGEESTSQRKKIYKEYKQGRAFQRKLNRSKSITLSLEEEKLSLRQQFVLLNEYLPLLPFVTLQINRVECDDVIALLAKHYVRQDKKVVIISNDRDFFQLISESISVHRPADKETYDPNTFKQKMGILPANYLLFKMIAGDKSDGITGVNGVKDDKQLGSPRFRKTIPMLYKNTPHSFDEVKEFVFLNAMNNSLLQKIKDSWNLVERNFKLMSLDNSITGRVQLQSIRLDEAQVPYFDKMEFRRKIIQERLHHHIINIESIITNFTTLST